jgi:V-type H+-transporting ATPase subunit H
VIIENSFLNDSKKIIQERIIPWEGLSRSNVISEEDANNIKQLEKQSIDGVTVRFDTSVQAYTNTLLSVLNKLDVNSKDDVVKNVNALINDLLIESPQFVDSLLKLSQLDSSLPYQPFLNHLHSKDNIIKILTLYNLTILLINANKSPQYQQLIDKEILIKIFDILTNHFINNNSIDSNYQIISIQILQELLIIKQFKLIFEKFNLIQNFAPINQLINQASKSPNSISLQLCYNILLVTWILSFSSSINKIIIHNYPDLIGNLLILSKDSIKLKIVRNSIAILKNFISIVINSQEQFKIIKILLFNDALSTINILKDRKFASNGSDEELSQDLQYLADNLNDVVTNKLTSLDEYLTELENPNLISWSSPTHKSIEFWLENSGKFKDSNWKLIKRMFEILSSKQYSPRIKIILLNDLQFLIKNLGLDLLNFIKSENSGEYKLLIMNFLDNNNNDSELKYEALKTIQLLVGHSV